ncbi:MAG: D-glycerate dehydrogenase [candidate division NC10 bacterium]|nr:D-glycerate dehydrogenase [candidate division NC10 bacterium]
MGKKPVVLVTRKLPQAVEDRLRRDYEARLNAEDRLYSSDELIALAAGADAILPCHTEHLTAGVIARLPESVRAIACFSVGVDHVDLAAAKGRGIVVTNTPDVLTDATAELTMLLMLGAARRASEGERLVRSGAWNTWSPNFMVGVQVTGKRLGIIGMGRVGQITARRARGFAMTVHYHNRRHLSPEVEAGATYHPTMDELLPHCDFLTLHCPATPETQRLLDARRIALLPDGAIVVNAARGSIVDEEALISALRSGKLAAAGLDVYNNEPRIHPAFRELPNTFLLPHVGSATRETRDAMGFRALDNLDAIVTGRAPRDRVA